MMRSRSGPRSRKFPSAKSPDISMIDCASNGLLGKYGNTSRPWPKKNASCARRNRVWYSSETPPLAIAWVSVLSLVICLISPSLSRRLRRSMQLSRLVLRYNTLACVKSIGRSLWYVSHQVAYMLISTGVDAIGLLGLGLKGHEDSVRGRATLKNKYVRVWITLNRVRNREDTRSVDIRLKPVAETNRIGVELGENADLSPLLNRLRYFTDLEISSSQFFFESIHEARLSACDLAFDDKHLCLRVLKHVYCVKGRFKFLPTPHCTGWLLTISGTPAISIRLRRRPSCIEGVIFVCLVIQSNIVRPARQEAGFLASIHEPEHEENNNDYYGYDDRCLHSVYLCLGPKIGSAALTLRELIVLAAFSGLIEVQIWIDEKARFGFAFTQFVYCKHGNYNNNDHDNDQSHLRTHFDDLCPCA